MTGGPAVDMPTSTTFELPGYTLERTLGLSWGLIVRSVGLTKGLTGTVRSLKAGEVKEFTEVVDRARHTARPARTNRAPAWRRWPQAQPEGEVCPR
jgi:uncharacterized protein YbjQ (UPF0145 family)